MFDENKQLKLKLKALQKEFKEKTEKIKRMKTAQLITYKKERDQSIKFSNENKKQLQKKIKENDLYRKRQVSLVIFCFINSSSTWSLSSLIDFILNSTIEHKSEFLK